MIMTKVDAVQVTVSTPPRQKQIESYDLNFGSFIDELVQELMSEIKKRMVNHRK